MKKGWLIWNVVLTLVAGFLLIRQFSSHTKKTDTVKTGNSLDSGNGNFRMAYFEMDSISTYFEMVKEVRAELNKKEEEINAEMEGLAKRFQQRLMYYQGLEREGKLSQAQSDSANQEIKRLDDEIKQRKQVRDQEYNDFMARRQNDIKSKIETFLKDYNKDKNFSYIVSYEQGLFYFKDTAYNITADVIKGLNEMYKASAKN